MNLSVSGLIQLADVQAVPQAAHCYSSPKKLVAIPVMTSSASTPWLKWRHLHHLAGTSVGTCLECRCVSGRPLRLPEYCFNDSSVLEKRTIMFSLPASPLQFVGIQTDLLLSLNNDDHSKGNTVQLLSKIFAHVDVQLHI